MLISKGEREGSINRIVAMCKENKIVVKTVDRKKLDFMCAGANHQGVVANVPAHSYSSVEDILEYAKSKGEAPFIIICDEIEDSHNLGAIIRSAEACGAHGVIIPKRKNVGLNFIVAKTSCGALEYVKAARVGNLAATIDELKKQIMSDIQSKILEIYTQSEIKYNAKEKSDRTVLDFFALLNKLIPARKRKVNSMKLQMKEIRKN